MEQEYFIKWSKIDRDFLELVKQHPEVYHRGKKRSTEFTQALKAISEEMCRLGHKIKPKSCRDKFRRIQKKFESINELSKLNGSFLNSKYLDGTLSFLTAEIGKKGNKLRRIDVPPAEVQQAKSNDSTVGFEFPPISLVSSDSDTESSASTATETYKNDDLRNKKKKRIKKLPSKDKPQTESENNVFETIERTTSKTIVSLEMIEALLRSKTGSSNLDNGRSQARSADDKSADVHLNLIVPFSKHQSNIEKHPVAGANTLMFMQTPDAASSAITPSHLHNITSTQANINSISYANISVDESDSNTVSMNENDDSSNSEVNNVKKEKTCILDINSEGDDIEVFLNEVADYVSDNYTLKQKMDIRLKICALVTAAEIEEIDEQCDS